MRIGQVHVEQQQIARRLLQDREPLHGGFADDEFDLRAQIHEAAHDLGIDRIVFDVDDAAPAVDAGFGRGLGVLFGRARRIGRDRQTNQAMRAFARLADDIQLAMHQFDQPFRDHEADSRAFFRRGVAAQAVERLEQLRDLLAGHADAGVGNVDLDLAGFERMGPDHDGTARLVVLERVGEQIREHLAQTRAVGQHPRRAGLDLGLHAQAALFALRREHGRAFVEQ